MGEGTIKKNMLPKCNFRHNFLGWFYGYVPKNKMGFFKNGWAGTQSAGEQSARRSFGLMVSILGFKTLNRCEDETRTNVTRKMETSGVTLTPMAGPRLKTGEWDKRRLAPGYMTPPAGGAVTQCSGPWAKQLRGGSWLASIYGLGLRDP